MSSLQVCPICLDKMLEKDSTGKIVPTITAECGHDFHFPCVMAHVARNTPPTCPLCRAEWRQFGDAAAPRAAAARPVPPPTAAPTTSVPSPTPRASPYTSAAPSPSPFAYPQVTKPASSAADDPVAQWNPVGAGPASRRRFDVQVEGRVDPSAFAASAAGDVTALVTVKSVELEAAVETVAAFVASSLPTPTAPLADGAGAGAGAGSATTVAAAAPLTAAAAPGAGAVSPARAPASALSATAPSAAQSRPPLDLVLLLDVSGSMGGTKISLVKETVLLVLSMLHAHDRVCLVEFNSASTVLTSLRRCEGAGLLALRAAATGLAASGGTNISSSLVAAQRVFAARTAKNPVTGVLLLSDGQSNDLQASLTAVRSLTALGASVHTFGFGADHIAAMMSGIAEAGNGTFTFVEQFDTVRECFGACIGSLTDVIAQGVVLELRPAAGVLLPRVHCSFPTSQPDGPSGVTLVQLGELCDGERRDIVLTLTLPALPSAPAAPLVAALGVAVAFSFPFAPAVRERRACDVSVSRPAVLPAEGPARDVEVDVHRNRIAASDAMASALAATSAGNFSAVSSILSSAAAAIAASPSCGLDVSAGLVEDLQACKARLSSREASAAGGASYAMQAMSGHRSQRAQYAPGGSNAVMWASKSSMSNADQVYATRSPGLAYAAGESPAATAMPSVMQRMAAKKKAGGDFTSSVSAPGPLAGMLPPPVPTRAHAPAPAHAPVPAHVPVPAPAPAHVLAYAPVAAAALAAPVALFTVLEGVEHTTSMLGGASLASREAAAVAALAHAPALVPMSVKVATASATAAPASTAPPASSPAQVRTKSAPKHKTGPTVPTA